MAARRRSSPRYVSKRGLHGTLYRFKIIYRDRVDAGSSDFDTYVWAYDAEHAEDKFFDSPDDDGWEIVLLSKVKE